MSRMLVTAHHTLRGWTHDAKFYESVYKELEHAPVHKRSTLIQFKKYCQGSTMWMVASLRCTRFLQVNAGTRLSKF